eukprot:gene3962-5681_t
MDWSSVFEDEGEEEGNWDRTDETCSTRIGMLQDFTEESYTPMVCYAFTVNYILGVGCLGIPYAFYKSGIILGTILVIFLSYISYITVMWVADATQQEIQLRLYINMLSKNPFITSPAVVTKKQLNKQTSSNNIYGSNNSIPANESSLLIHNNSEIAFDSNKNNINYVNYYYSSISKLWSDVNIDESVIEMRSSGTLNNPNNSNNNNKQITKYSNHLINFSQPDQYYMNNENKNLLIANNQNFKIKIKNKKDMYHRQQFSSSVYKSINSNSTHNNSYNDSNEEDIGELEVTELALEFLGVKGKIIYQTALMALTYVGLLAYTQVFNDSFNKQILFLNENSHPLWSYLSPLLFSCVVIPLSCFDLAEQIPAQVLMSILRFISLSILLFGTIIAIIIDPPPKENYTIHWNFIPSHSLSSSFFENMSILLFTVYSSLLSSIKSTVFNSSSYSLPIIQWNGFGMMFTTAIFSQLFQHSVPGLIRPLSKTYKKHIPTIFKYALITTSFLYITTGIFCVLYFGNDINQSVNLNFIGFTWGINKHGQGHGDTNKAVDSSSMNSSNELLTTNYKSSIIIFISMIVVLFPALDTLSVFPLIANTLGNNLYSSFPHLFSFIKQGIWNPFSILLSSSSSSFIVDKISYKRYVILIWRLIAAIPPIIASFIIKDLSLSLQFAGLCGIIVALIIPALLKRKSQVRITLVPLSMQSAISYKIGYNNRYYSIIVILLAIIALLISLYQMII